jgi:hypothetical protein
MPVVGREWFLLLPQLHRHRPRFLSTFTQNVRHQRHRVQSKVQSGVVYSFTHVSTPSIFASLGHPLSDQKVGSALVLRPTSFNLSRMLCPLPRTFLIKSRTRLTLTARVHRMLHVILPRSSGVYSTETRLLQVQSRQEQGLFNPAISSLATSSRWCRDARFCARMGSRVLSARCYSIAVASTSSLLLYCRRDANCRNSNKVPVKTAPLCITVVGLLRLLQ